VLQRYSRFWMPRFHKICLHRYCHCRFQITLQVAICCTHGSTWHRMDSHLKIASLMPLALATHLVAPPNAQIIAPSLALLPQCHRSPTAAMPLNFSLRFSLTVRFRSRFFLIDSSGVAFDLHLVFRSDLMCTTTFSGALAFDLRSLLR